MNTGVGVPVAVQSQRKVEPASTTVSCGVSTNSKEIYKTKALLERNNLKIGEVLEKLTEKPTKSKRIFEPNEGYCF